jgi:hypothetical protein
MNRFFGSSPVVTTNNYYTIADLHNLQSLHTNLLCPNLYSTNLHNSLTAPIRTALVPISFSTANSLQISLHYSTHKVFKSHVKVSTRLLLNSYRLLAAADSSSLRLPDEITLNSLHGFPHKIGTDHAENTVLFLRHVPRHHYLGSPLSRWLLPSNEP